MKSFTNKLKKWKKNKNKQDQGQYVEEIVSEIKEVSIENNNDKTSSLFSNKYGLCLECQRLNTGRNWCQTCNAKRFTQNFKNWTSGDQTIDKLIQKCQQSAINRFSVLEWIPYEQFTEIEYLAEGGFGKVYKAYWESGYISTWNIKDSKWKRSKYSKEVILKSLNNLLNTDTEFLHEITCYKLFSREFNHIVRCYGISHNSQTNNYLIVMQYIPSGNLRQYLQNNYSKLSFRDKFTQLRTIAKGLNSIHQQNLVHCDLHPGNILNQVVSDNVICYITDLGLSRLISEKHQKEKVYGVLPYIAPEILYGQFYTPAADIYAWGMISYEILTGLPPYHKLTHDEFLTMQICKGLRPHFPIKMPLLLENLINQCWDADPEQRPTSSELYEILNNWHDMWVGNFNDENVEFASQYQEVEKINRNVLISGDNLIFEIHPQAIYTSRLLEFKNLCKPQNSREINEQFYKFSQSVEFDIRDFNKYWEEQQNLVNWFKINPNFTNELISSWISLNFSPSQTCDWLSIDLSPTDHHFCAWLRDELRLEPLEVLNNYQVADLKEQFAEYQSQIQQPSK